MKLIGSKFQSMFGLFNQYIINFISFNSKKTHMKSTMIITILLVCFSSICHSASLDDDEPYYGMATGLTEYIGPFYTNYPGTINISISTNPSTLLYLELDKNGESVAGATNEN